MSQIAIKGHTSRGKEVIEILETLGGKNDYYLPGDTSRAYYVLEYGEIHTSPYIYGNEPYTFFTLEEFESKYPFKVDDKVIYNEEDIAKIVGMSWDEDVDEIYYSITSHDETFKCPVDLLQPYNEETIEEKTDKALAPDLRGEDYYGRRFGYKIPNGYEFDCIKNNKIILKPKQPQYPKTYIECAKILNCFSAAHIDGYKNELLEKFQELLICRNAYWELVGEQMGLDKPWEPDWTAFEGMPAIFRFRYNIVCDFIKDQHCLLVFPTEEMRDAFYENFKDLIETCKELL